MLLDVSSHGAITQEMTRIITTLFHNADMYIDIKKVRILHYYSWSVIYKLKKN
jgi:hypothetical protein